MALTHRAYAGTLSSWALRGAPVVVKAPERPARPHRPDRGPSPAGRPTVSWRHHAADPAAGPALHGRRRVPVPPGRGPGRGPYAPDAPSGPPPPRRPLRDVP